MKKNHNNDQKSLEAIFNVPHTGLLTCDKNGHIEASNDCMSSFLGEPTEGLQGKSIYNYLDKANANIFSRFLQSESHGEMIIKLKSSSLSENEYELKIGKTGKGENYLITGFATPIPSPHQQQKNYYPEGSELQTQFLSIASHELKLPLAGLLSSLNLIERYLKSAGEEWRRFSYKDKVEKHLRTFKISLKTLQNITTEFLSINNIEQGKIQVHYEKLNLQQFLDKHKTYIIETLRPKQQLIYQYEACNSEILIDKYFLHSLIDNLIFNAIKYSHENSKISLNAIINGQTLSLNVKDEGIGIPILEQDKIFECFYRAKNVSNYEGTGLGLTITKKYVEMLGGSISVKSNVNKGSTFIISLPIKP